MDHPPLTGLLNRRAFDPLLSSLVSDAAERDRPLSMVVFDLDHFKRLNDEHGHLEGDRALERSAVVLRAQSREGDLVARTAGICSATRERETADTMLLRADQALYAAKAAGRCRAACWDGGVTVLPPFGEPTAA